MAKKDMPRKVSDPPEIRIRVSQLGDYYRDRLYLDALVNGSTPAAALIGNCKSSLDRKEAKIDQKLKWMAAGKGITIEEMAAELLGRSPAPPEQSKLRSEAISAIDAIPPDKIGDAIAALKKIAESD